LAGSELDAEAEPARDAAWGAERVHHAMRPCSSTCAMQTHLRQSQTQQSRPHRQQWSQESPRDWRHTPRMTWPSSDSQGSTSGSPSAAAPRPPPTLHTALRRRVSPVHWRQEAGRRALLPTQNGGAVPTQQLQHRNWKSRPRQRGLERESSWEHNPVFPLSGSTWSCPRRSRQQPS
jgi:hypothetical protein